MNDPSASVGSGADPRPQNTESTESSSWPKLALETAEPTGFGRGWINGLISAILGLAHWNVLPAGALAGRYGLCERQTVPNGWFRQFLYPFVRL